MMPPDKKNTATDRPGGVKKKDITDTEGWKSSTRGFKRFWTNYKAVLVDSFNRMTRSEQEDLIDKFAMIVTIGVTCLIVLIFYPVIPRLLRVLGLPVAMLVAWWAGRKIVGPVVIDRMEHMLKRDDSLYPGGGRDDREDRDDRGNPDR
jgi:hypothetical protein